MMIDRPRDTRFFEACQSMLRASKLPGSSIATPKNAKGPYGTTDRFGSGIPDEDSGLSVFHMNGENHLQQIIDLHDCRVL